MSGMKEVAARDAKNRFGQLLDAAQREPVRITRSGRGIAVMLSVEQYERLRGATGYGALSSTMDAMAAEAQASGLTDAKLVELLADDS